MDPEIGSGKSFAPGQTFSEGEIGYSNPGISCFSAPGGEEW